MAVAREDYWAGAPLFVGSAAPLASSSVGVATLSSGGSASMSVMAALSVACCGASLQAARASSSARELAAARISETRHWTALRTHQPVGVKRQRLVFGPGLAFAGEGEVGAERVGGGFGVGGGNGARFVEAQAVGADDQQPLGVAARRGAIARRHAPAAVQGGGDGGRRTGGGRSGRCPRRILRRGAV